MTDEEYAYVEGLRRVISDYARDKAEGDRRVVEFATKLGDARTRIEELEGDVVTQAKTYSTLSTALNATCERLRGERDRAADFRTLCAQWIELAADLQESDDGPDRAILADLRAATIATLDGTQPTLGAYVNLGIPVVDNLEIARREAVFHLTTARADLAKARGRIEELEGETCADCADIVKHKRERDRAQALNASVARIADRWHTRAEQGADQSEPEYDIWDACADEIDDALSPAPPEPDTDGRTDGGCDLFERGPRSPIADCISDGHYQCVECVELSEEGADIRRANEDDGHLRGGESDLDSPSWTEKEGG